MRLDALTSGVLLKTAERQLTITRKRVMPLGGQQGENVVGGHGVRGHGVRAAALPHGIGTVPECLEWRSMRN